MSQFTFEQVLREPDILIEHIKRRVQFSAIPRAPNQFQIQTQYQIKQRKIKQQVRSFSIFCAAQMAIALINAHREYYSHQDMLASVSSLECTFCVTQLGNASHVLEFVLNIEYDFEQ